MSFKELPTALDFAGDIVNVVPKDVELMVIKAIENAQKNAWNNAMLFAAENGKGKKEGIYLVVDKDSII